MNQTKTVIYGSGRYPRDFLYIFKDIKVDYYIDDIESNGVSSYKRLTRENNVYVIICKYDETDS